jgi:cardiolipin synthase
VIRQLRAAPNLLTLLRLIFIPFIIISVVEGHFRWAMGLFLAAGFTDALDGLLARVLRQQTALGLYLDPIADKLLLSSLFLVLSFRHLAPWYVTVLVLSRDIGILIVSAILYATNTMRDLSPTLLGKLNTALQVATLFLILLHALTPSILVADARRAGLWLTFALSLISWIHYTIRVGHRARGGTVNPGT